MFIGYLYLIFQFILRLFACFLLDPLFALPCFEPQRPTLHSQAPFFTAFWLGSANQSYWQEMEVWEGESPKCFLLYALGACQAVAVSLL